MKTTQQLNGNYCWARYGCLLLLVVSSFVPLLSPAVSLTDFGYQHMAVNGKIASGNQPLLLICVNFAGQSPLPQPLSYYSNLVFNASQTPSFNGYFHAVSDGAFSFAPGGAVLVTLPATDVFTNVYAKYPAPPNPFATADGVYASNIIHTAMSSFNFASSDANHDGHVTQDELAIVIIVSDSGWTAGGCRPVPQVLSTGITWGNGSVSLLGYPAPFIVMLEETEETLGTPDIYSDGCLSQWLTPQSCFFVDPSDPNGTYYLDPWNRMQLGWCQPRIYSLTAGDSTTISAAQASDPTAPIILYDPAQGTGEFFILEYRTHTNSVFGSGYDTRVDNRTIDGLAIWHVQQDAQHNPTQVQNLAGTGLETAVFNEAPPNLQRGGYDHALWGSNTATPFLTWFSGAQSKTIIQVRPFTPGANSIVVQWLSGLDTWVDFNDSGITQDGSFSFPFKTFSQGVNAVSYGGKLHLKTGTSSETVNNLTKPMHIQAYNGPATIGH